MFMIELVNRARKGDEEAYLTLFRQYEEDLYRVAYAILGHSEDALDVVQETAYRSFKAIKGLKEPRYFKTWLTKIAIGCSTDVFRKRTRTLQWRPEYEAAIAAGASDDGDPALSLTLGEMVASLDLAEKQVVMLRYYYDFTIREVAEAMNVPLGTAKTTLYRALQKLRKRAEEDDVYGYR